MGPIKTLLFCAALDWAMAALLFAASLLALAARRLAGRFGLHAPCLLCTRLGHLLVQPGPGLRFDDSVCGPHKRDVSSFAYCRTHERLSDIRAMCRSCLLSFAADKDSPDCEKYKPLVGILRKEIECVVEGDDPKSREKDLATKCSCCGEIWRARAPPSRTVIGGALFSSPRAVGRNEEWCGFESPRVRSLAGIESPRFRRLTRNESPRLRRLEGESPRFRCSEGESPRVRCSEGDSSKVVDNRGKEDVVNATTALIQPDSKDTNDDANRTPKLARPNKILGLPLNSAPVSPRWVSQGFRKLMADKGELISEPTDAGQLTEVETDILNRLRRQVRLDHSSLKELYVELDEERNASNVAANNAMAMITRLQAEKAAVQMEALQYQRMMEEQAEYDEEALQAMKEMLDKKDEDINALSATLEKYREKFGVMEKEGSEPFWEAEDDEDYQERKSQSSPSFGENSDSGSLNGGGPNESEHAYNQDCVEKGGGDEEILPFDFDGERRFLLGLLTDLEKRLSADEGRNSLEFDTIKHENEGKNETSTLTREVSSLKERLRAIEEDSTFLKQAAMSLQKGEEGTKLLTEIAQHLRKIRQSMRLLPSVSNMVA